MSQDPTPEQLAELPGLTLLEFGASWCSYCQAAQPLIAGALGMHRGIRHIRIEDGKGKRLGRQFKVKLWPSLILLKDGTELARIVRPEDSASIARLLQANS